jgi:hypothetical protein
MTYYVMSVDAVALAAGTAKSVLELSTPATDRVWIKEWWVEFDGVTSTAVPVKVEAGRFSAAVTTATTFTAGKFDAADGTASSTAKHTATVEGAGTIDAGAVLHRIPPTSGYHYVAPLGQELVVPVSGFWRLRLTAAAIVNATVGVVWFE